MADNEIKTTVSRPVEFFQPMKTSVTEMIREESIRTC
jgi:hypothetical protein